jgi:hypothetical protein
MKSHERSNRYRLRIAVAYASRVKSSPTDALTGTGSTNQVGDQFQRKNAQNDSHAIGSRRKIGFAGRDLWRASVGSQT